MKYDVQSWSAGPYPPYVVVLLDQPEIGPEWMSWLTLELSRSGFLLDTEGSIEVLAKNGSIEPGSCVGFYRFLDVDETQALLRDAQVEVSALTCPWSGAVRGAFGWASLGNSATYRNFLSTIVLRAQGPMIRTEDWAVRELVREVTFELEKLTSRFGFGDGDAFLNREPDYMAYVIKVAEKALEDAGLDAYVALKDTHHNPLLIWGPIRRKRDGKEVGESALYGKSMTIWAYDYSCLDDYSFW